MKPERDTAEDPYTAHEEQVARYLSESGLGGGTDPVGFLILSHREIGRQKAALAKRLREAGLPDDAYGDADAPG